MRPLPALLVVLSSAAHAGAPELVFLAPQNHTMPLARFEQGQIKEGILKDLGEAIAARVGRTARFLSVPSKRVSYALQAGEADGVCYVMPGWIDGDYHWSQPLIPTGAAVVSRTGVPRMHALAELSGHRIGTVLGYRYTTLEHVLGPHFVRDDAANARLTLDKLLAGRVDYAILAPMTVRYFQRNGALPELRIDVSFDTATARCAFTTKASVPAKDIDRAIAALAAEGAVDAILAKYR